MNKFTENIEKRLDVLERRLISAEQEIGRLRKRIAVMSEIEVDFDNRMVHFDMPDDIDEKNGT